MSGKLNKVTAILDKKHYKFVSQVSGVDDVQLALAREGGNSDVWQGALTRLAMKLPTTYYMTYGRNTIISMVQDPSQSDRYIVTWRRMILQQNFM